MENTSAHTFVYGDIYEGRCMFCDCRPWGIHAAHPCTESADCSEFHN